MQIETIRVRDKRFGNEVDINKTDFDPAIYEALDAPKAPPAKPAAASSSTGADTTPGPISTVNTSEATDLVDAVATIEELDRLEADERASQKNPGGRKGVLTAIEKRRAALVAA